MATGSGLDAQVGTKTESPVGTEATVDHFWPFESAGLSLDPSYIEGTGIQAGSRFLDVNQVGIARKTASGSIVLPVTMGGKFGWWWNHCIGSTGTPVVIATTAYKQIHTPGTLYGKSFTTQVGKPQPGDGVVKPATYKGCKVTDWELAFEDNSPVKLNMSVDAWDEDLVTGLTAATYTNTYNLGWNFSHVTLFKTGGTPSTTAGLTSIAGGTTVPSVVTKMSISGKNTLATDRYGLGNAGIKKEQIETDFCGITGSFEGEFDETTWSTPCNAGTTVAMQIDCSYGDAGSANPFLLSVILPTVKITSAPAEVSGPGLVTTKGEFKVYDPKMADSTPPIQIVIVGRDTAIV